MGKSRFRLGVYLEDLNNENRVKYKIPLTTKGVVVTESTGEETLKKEL